MPRGFIFGGDTGASYDDIQRREAIINQLAQRAISAAPRNVGEGISALGSGLATYLAGTALADQKKETTAAGQQAFQDLLTTLSTPQPPATASQAGGVPVGPLPSSAVSPGPGAAAAPGPPAGGAAGVTPTAGSPAGLSPRAMQLLQASANPSLNPSQRNVIGALLNRELNTSAPDPVALAQGATLVDPRTGRVIAKGASGDQKGFTLSPGQQRFGPGGQQIAAVPEARQDFTLGSGQQRFDATGKRIAVAPTKPTDKFRTLTLQDKQERGLPPQGTYQENTRSGQISPIGGSSIGGQVNIEAGYKAVYDEAGNVVGAEVIPGSKAAQKLETVKKAEETQKRTLSASADSVLKAGGAVLKNLDDATIPPVGLFASWLGYNTPSARNIRNSLETIKSAVSLDRLTELKKQAGGVGAISDTEMRLLGASVASLEQSQTEEQFRDNLGTVLNRYTAIVRGPEQANKEFPLAGGTPAAAGTPDAEGWITGPGGIRIREKQ